MISEAALTRISRLSPARLVVGFSGGVDSHVLLHALAALQLPIELHALHINHGLSPESNAWEQHCERVCDGLNIGFTAIRVQVSAGNGVEGRARVARYQAYESFLLESDLLLLAHHVDDQVETALLSLLRGSSRPGVHGMPTERFIGKSRLLRPLLDVTRMQIEQYARAQALDWIEDASNQDTSFNRNYIRHEVVPVLEGRWPDLANSMLNAIQRDAEFSQLIDSIGEDDLASLLQPDGGISLSGFSALPPLRRSNLVRAWLARFDLPLPRETLLRDELSNLVEAAPDAAPLLTWQGVCLRRYAQEIYLTNEVAEIPEDVYSFQYGNEIDVGAGVLTATPAKGKGLAIRDLSEVTVRFRQGGERMQLARRRSVKKLLQESNVPAWLRECLPLIYHEQGEVLVAISGLPGWQVPMRVAAGFSPDAEETGFEFTFRLSNQPYSH